MIIFSILALLVVGQPLDSEGYLTVRSTLPGIEVYYEGDYLGRTPIDQYPVEAGTGILTIVSNDSLENVYASIRTGGIGEKLSSVWTLTAIDAGTYRVDVPHGSVATVTIDYNAVLAAPTRTKAIVGCGFGCIFGLGAVIGLLLGLFIT